MDLPQHAPRLQSPHVARFADAIGLLRRKAGAGAPAPEAGEGQPAVPASVAAEIANSRGAGQPLPARVRSFMEPRFGSSFEGVRIHTGDRAAALNRQLSARAFTVGDQIFFGRGQFQPDSAEGRQLIAHELTHTIQQTAAPRPRDIERAEDVHVRQTAPLHVQRLGMGDVLDYFARAANAIPGYRMFTIVLGVNPINRARADRSAANILRAIVEFLPGGVLVTQALDNYGVFERAGAWVEQQLQTLGISGGLIRDALDRFLDSLGFSDIFHLGSVWERARRIFTDPIDRIVRFARSLFAGILRFVKDAILMPIARLASNTRGWDLLCAVLGRNPITGEAVPRTAATLIGGFMKLIGQEEVWQNIQRGNAVARAWAWFQGALGGLLGFVRQIPQLFVQALSALEIGDLVLLPRAFARVAGVFGGFIANFVSWAGDTVWALLEIIFSVVAPSLMVYLRRAAGAFRTILRDPITFVGHLVRAAMAGFRQFAGRFLTHLRASLIGWITGALSGANIYIPQAFTVQEIVKFVLSVLGLTWQNIRQKLVRAIGEPAVRVLETSFDIVVTLVREGPGAAWQKIQETLGNLRDIVMDQVMSFVQERVVSAAVTRLLSLLTPAGAFIQAIIATYNTVMFFVERLRQIAQVAASFIDSLATIAAGNIAAAANRVEQTMAGLLTLVISFLARIAGLGRVSDAITSVVERVRRPIDRALDRIVDWVVEQGRRLGRLALQVGVPQDPVERVRRAGRDAVAIARGLRGRVTRSLLEPALSVLRARYGLSRIEPREQNGQWWVFTKVNAEANTPTGISTDPNAAPTGTGAAAANPEFPYRIAVAAMNDLSDVVSINRGGETPRPWQRFPIGYIGNTPVHRGNVADIARQYLTAFSGGLAEAQQRFALVVGVNMFDDLRGQNERTVRSMVGAGAGVNYPWTVFGFVWRPNWVNVGANRNVPQRVSGGVQEVRRIVEQNRAVRLPLALAAETDFIGRIRDSVPIGPIRDYVRTRFHQTRLYEANLRQRVSEIFVHVTDPDTVSFNPIRDGGARAEPLFARYDRIVQPLVNAIREDAARRDSQTIFVSGGYEFELAPVNGEPISEEQTRDIRVYVGGLLGRAVQAAMASVEGGSRAVYFTEANLLIRVTRDQSLRGSFSARRHPFTAETRRIIESVMRNGGGNNVTLLFAPDASIVTGAREFAIGDGRARTDWHQPRGIDARELHAMINMRQGPAERYNWVTNIISQYGLAGQRRQVFGPLSELWLAYFPISARHGGMEPIERLREAVRNRAFTREAAFGEISGEFANHPDPEIRRIITRFAPYAEAAGRALGEALDAVFIRFGMR